MAQWLRALSWDGHSTARFFTKASPLSHCGGAMNAPHTPAHDPPRTGAQPSAPSLAFTAAAAAGPLTRRSPLPRGAVWSTDDPWPARTQPACGARCRASRHTCMHMNASPPRTHTDTHTPHSVASTVRHLAGEGAASVSSAVPSWNRAVPIGVESLYLLDYLQTTAVRYSRGSGEARHTMKS